MGQIAEYPHLYYNEYFSPNRIFGEDFGLFYDYHTGVERNFTYGNYRCEASPKDYADIRNMIEALPEIQPLYELRALCCVPWDDAGTSVAFALAHKGSHRLLPASPFASANFGWPEFYARNPHAVVKALCQKRITASGNLMSYGQYLLLNKDRQR